jgi:hypothetical protein
MIIQSILTPTNLVEVFYNSTSESYLFNLKYQQVNQSKIPLAQQLFYLI